MKRILLIPVLFLFSIACFSQSVSCDLFLSNAHFEDLGGNVIDANNISYNQAVRIKVTIHNGNPAVSAPSGHFRIRIGLGSGMVISPGFNFTTAALNTSFNWSYDLNGAQPQIVGTSIAALAPDFAGIASFDLNAAASVISTASYNLLISNPPGTPTPLSDPDFTNNLAANGYTVASAITFSTVTQNVSCFNDDDGKITVTAAGGIPPYTITIVNSTTSTTASNATGIFTGLTPGPYNISVTDGFGNSNTGTASINEPIQVTVSATSTNVSCNGATNGTITISGVSIGATTTVKKDGVGADLNGQLSFGPGTYVVTASAPNGNSNGFCTKDVTVIIIEPVAVTLAATATNVSCFGLGDGTITATSSGATITVNGNAYNATTSYGPGTYTVVASAPNGNANGFCTNTKMVTIGQPPQITLNVSKTNVSCFSQANGTITASATGGATITVNGNPYNPSDQYGPGTYTIVATAAGGNTGQTCTKTTTVIISAPDAVTLTVTSANVSCNGLANGTITVNGLSTGATSTIKKDGIGADLSSQLTFGPGTYVVTATATNGNNNGVCTKDITVTITQPVAVTVSVVATNVLCNGAANGTISISGLSTNATTTIRKDGVGADLTAQTNFSPGAYVVTASATNGNLNGSCTKDTTVTISEPVKVILSVVAANVSCKGSANGTIVATASAGTSITVDGAAYVAGTQYSPGTYHIIASASNGNVNGFCTKDTTVIIIEPAAITLSALRTNVSCNGQANGTIIATASTGAVITISGQPYNASAQYGPGSYLIVATAAGGNTGQTCTKDTTVVISQPLTVTLSVVATNVSCNGAANGTINISNVAGETVTIKKDGIGADLILQTNFAPGIYVITASVQNGNMNGFCTKDTTVTITQPLVLTESFLAQANNACHGGNNGAFSVTAGGGTPSYSYTIAGPTVNITGAATGAFTGLTAGTYTITVTDANSCTAFVTRTIAEPSGTTPDVILSVADYTDNFFPANATEITLIYQVTEIGGNPALNDLLLITKQANYTFTLPSISTITVGTGANAIIYPLDNSRWAANNSNPVFFTASLNSGLKIACGQSVYLAVKLTRGTPNKSIFTITSVVQNVTGEVITNNNSTTVVLVGQ